MKKLNGYIPVLMIAVMTIIISACSARKNTAGSRFWQAFNTRYNVYYHGKTHYDEQVKILENDYQDDYSQRLFIHPAEAYANPKSPQPSSNFDRTIEKMQKAISLHSIKKKPKKKGGKGNDEKYREWMKRDEYNPFIHNAWYTLAKAQYMKGDFESASATFRYIQRHFTWKPDLVLEAKIWEALSYCALGWTTEADNILNFVHLDQIEDKRILSLANLAYADYYIKNHQYHEAVPYLSEAVKGSKGGQKVRLNFLLGQLLEEDGQYDAAYQAYKRAGSYSGSTYRTKFNARIKQSAVYHGDNIQGEVRSLKSMTRYDRNKEYLDQIYYAIGNLYLSRQDTVNAIENYKLAAEKSTRNGVDKAISQLTLGAIYFAQHKYDLAQPCYSEAIPLINEEYPNYKVLKQRSDVLDELAVYSGNVNLQDSLLTLSEMPEEEQRKIIQKIIADLKEQEKRQADEAQREEYLAQQNAQGNKLNNNQSNAPTEFNINNDDSWYFYNTVTKNSGKTAFAQQWGNRKLEDNWRRRNKNTFSLDENALSDDENLALNDSTGNVAGDSVQVDQKALERANDPHFEEYYFKQIPKTDEEKQNCHNIIQEGLYNMGVILKDKLEDLPAAEYEFEQLLSRYPDNTYRLDTYYNLYLLHMRAGNYTSAEKYRLLVVTEFPESKYGMALQDPNYLENLKNMNRVEQQLYDDAYTAYLNNNNTAVHAAYRNMMDTYPLSKIMPKFMFLDALAYVTEGNGEKFKTTLREMLERYPDTDITPMASSMVKQLQQGRKINGGNGKNVRGMIWSTRLTNDSTSMADLEKEMTPFGEDLDKPQLFILVYSTDSVSSNELLYRVARHNFSAFVVKDFDLEQMNFGNLGLLIVKGFINYRDVSHYRTVFEQDAELMLPEQVHPVIISENNFNLLLNEGRTFEEYFRYLDDKNNEEVEGQIPDDETKGEEGEEENSDENNNSKPAPKDDKPDAKGSKNVGTSGLYHNNQSVSDSIPVNTPPANVPPVDTPPTDNPLVVNTPPANTPPVDTPPADNPLVVNTPPANVPPVDTPPSDNPLVVNTPPANVPPVNQPKVDQPDKPAVNNSAVSQPKVDQPKQDNNSNTSTRKLKKRKDDETKQREREQKEEQKRMKRAEKARQDSIKAVEKARQKALKDAEKLKNDSIKAVEKRKQDEQKAAQQAKKDQAKQKQAERKQREQARKQKQKEREQARKQREREKKQQARERKEAAKQKKKEREQARKQREQERKQRQKEKKK